MIAVISLLPAPEPLRVHSPHRYALVASEDDVIDERQVHHLTELREAAGQVEVVGGGREVAGWMIVRDDELRSAEEQGIAEDDLRVHHHVIHRAGGQHLEACHVARDVHHQHHEMLLVVVQPREDRLEDLADLPAVAHGQYAEALLGGDQRVGFDRDGPQRPLVHGVDGRKVEDGVSVTALEIRCHDDTTE